MRRRAFLVLLATSISAARAEDASDFSQTSASTTEKQVPDVALIESLSDAELQLLDDEEGFNALHRAAAVGALDVVEAIIKRPDIDVNLLTMQTQQGVPISLTALSHACNKGHSQIARLLMERGADLERGSPLVLAASNGHVEMMQLLIDAGASVNRPSDFMQGSTALIAAATMGQSAAVDILLAADADVTYKDTRGASALQTATAYLQQLTLDPRLSATFDAMGGGEHKAVVKTLRKALAAQGKKAKEAAAKGEL